MHKESKQLKKKNAKMWYCNSILSPALIARFEKKKMKGYMLFQF